MVLLQSIKDAYGFLWSHLGAYRILKEHQGGVWTSDGATQRHTGFQWNITGLYGIFTEHYRRIWISIEPLRGIWDPIYRSGASKVWMLIYPKFVAAEWPKAILRG
jgi:hypothetical protein